MAKTLEKTAEMGVITGELYINNTVKSGCAAGFVRRQDRVKLSVVGNLGVWVRKMY